MAELQGPPAELRMTIEVKRAATGIVETFELVGHVVPETQEPMNGNDSQHGGA